MHQPDSFRSWHSNSQYIIALQTKTAQELEELYLKLQRLSFEPIAFKEPDLGHSLTAFALPPHEGNKRQLANLRLAGRQSGAIEKPTAVLSSIPEGVHS